MKLFLDLSTDGLGVRTEDDKTVVFRFPSALRTEKDGSISMFSENYETIAYETDLGAVDMHIKAQSIMTPIEFRVDDAEEIRIVDSATLSVQKDGTNYLLMLTDAVFQDTMGEPVIVLHDMSAKMSITMASATIRAFSSRYDPTTQAYFVPAGKRAPEFTIGVFDAVALTSNDQPALDGNGMPFFQRLRPLRYGAPVISTRPVERNNVSETISLDDQSILDDSLFIPNQRRIYFRVVCNETLPASLNLFLLVFMPGGMDTLKTPPVFIELKKVSGKNIYWGSHLFNKSNGLNFIDGFAYLSVYAPLAVQSFLPLALDVKTGDSADQPARYTGAI
jgi:hypothetical protein